MSTTVVQGSQMAHVRVVGAESDRTRALQVLHEMGWKVTRSGPLLLPHHRVDSARYELIAEKVVGGDNPWSQALKEALSSPVTGW